jgi:outer membrane protein assembly factor BamB
MKIRLVVALVGFAISFGVPSTTRATSDVLTNRNDNARTGLVSDETTLTPASVMTGLKLLFQNPVDGAVYAQPLCVSNQLVYTGGVSRGFHDLVIIATENGSVYAFDAATGKTYWNVSVLTPGFKAVNASDPNVKSIAIQPIVGITATPVIDRNAAPNGQIFVVTMETDGEQHYDYKLHALDLATGQDALIPVTIAASITGNGPATTFVAQNQLPRSALLLSKGIIYTGFASFGDRPPYSGWLIGYCERDLSQALVFNANPNGSPATRPLRDGSGGGIWQSGTGPSADNNGNIYLAIGNGPFDETLVNGFPANGDYGNSLLKLSGSTVSDYFTPHDELSLVKSDEDLGAGGVALLPDIVDSNGNVHSLAMVVCKNSSIYLVDRKNLGKFNPSTDTNYQTLFKALSSQAYTSSVFFNNSIYLCGGFTPLMRFIFDFSIPNQPLLYPTPVAKTLNSFGKRGCIPSISSNAGANGIVWAYETNLGKANAILYAYDAATLTELYNSGSLLARGVKFAVPTIFSGKVYVGTSKSVAAFGL